MKQSGKKEGQINKYAFNTPKDKVNQKKYVFQGNNDGGFTLIEALLSFMIFCIISLSIPLLMKGVETIKNEMVPPYYYEWNLFSESLKNELWKGTDIKVLPQEISFNKNGEKISYEKYNSSIRRRVNDTGHEVVLQSVGSFSLTPLEQGIRINVDFNNGERVESEFFYYDISEMDQVP